jgi:hypothetical protein
MAERERFAYYRRTAPLEDVRFMLRVARLSPTLRAAFVALEAQAAAGLARAQVYAQYVVLQDRWRVESHARLVLRPAVVTSARRGAKKRGVA